MFIGPYIGLLVGPFILFNEHQREGVDNHRSIMASTQNIIRKLPVIVENKK